MKTIWDSIKGIHPGIYLGYELKKRQIKKNQFAHSLHVNPNVISKLTRGLRRMDQALAERIEQVLSLEPGKLMWLQQFYDIQQKENRKTENHPKLSHFRPVLFWDTQIERINWNTQKRAIIKRVFERGNQMEKDELKRFYGMATINATLHATQ